MASKYNVGSQSTRTLDGIVFDSAKEARRYFELRELQLAGEISELRLQPRFVLLPPSEHPTFGALRQVRYYADFSYRRAGTYIVEDVKGKPTNEYLLKRALFLRQHPEIDFREV